MRPSPWSSNHSVLTLQGNKKELEQGVIAFFQPMIYCQL